MNQSREPLFNIPAVMLALLALLALVHAVRTYLLSSAQDFDILLLFSFIPARYESNLLLSALPGGTAADIWTFVTYGLLHADLTHLGINAVWLLAFGTPLARRFGASRFLLFLAATAAVGAVAHLLTHGGERVPMIGASAAISGAMAGSMRFAFQRGGPIFGRGDEAAHVPALPLGQALTDMRLLVFLAVWFGVNLIFGLGAVPLSGDDQAVAWQAHVGGFVAGLLLFGFFDPVKREEDRNLPEL